jgi:DNA-binding beta-propeller fold protein YncE
MRFPALFLTIVLASCTAPNASNPSNAFVPQGARELVAVHPVAHWARTSIGVFGDPYGVAVDSTCRGSCDVFVSDPGNKTVYVVRPDGSRSPVADFSGVRHFDPQGVGYDHGYREILVADKAPGSSSFVYIVAGVGATPHLVPDSYAPYPKYNRGVAGYSFYHTPTNQANAIYAAQATHLPLTTKGAVTCVRGSTYCLFQSHVLSDPYDVAIDEAGTPFAVDARDKKAYRLLSHDAIDLGMTFVDPYGIAVTPDGKYVYVADAGAKKVYQRSPDGVWTEIGAFADPYAVAVQADRTVYVADHGDRHVYKLTP